MDYKKKSAIKNHSFSIEFATNYGLVESIILQNLIFWIEHNSLNEKNFHNGYYWTFNSQKAFKEMFPYLSEKKIRNALKKLEDLKIIKSDILNKNKYDRTKWYCILDKSICPKGQMDLPKNKNGLVKTTNGDVQRGKPIPDINTHTNTNVIKNNKHIEYSFFIDILNYWNLKNIRNHKEKMFLLNINSSSNTLKKSFKEIKKEFTLETIKKAIDNYKTILEDEKYFWSKKWNCWEFLTRGLLKFIDDASPFDNYLNFNQVDKKLEENNNRKIRNNGKIITEDEYLKKQLKGFVDRQFPEDIKFYKEKIKEKEFQEKLRYIFKNKKKPENVKEIDYKDIIFYIKSKFFILKDGEFVANSDLSVVLENAKKLESKSIMKEIEGKRK